MGRSIEVEAVGAQVRLSLREFEGVGQAEHTTLCIVSPAEARRLIDALAQAVMQADARHAAICAAEREKLIAERDRIEARLAAFDRGAPLRMDAL